jgi:hypothetical protein
MDESTKQRISDLERSNDELRAVLVLAERQLERCDSEWKENGLVSLIREVRQQSWTLRKGPMSRVAEAGGS